MDEDPLRRLRDVRRAIYSERDRRLAEAWKAPLKQESSLAILIREPSVPIKRVADVLRAECARRGRGKPGGAQWRWTKPIEPRLEKACLGDRAVGYTDRSVERVQAEMIAEGAAAPRLARITKTAR